MINYSIIGGKVMSNEPYLNKPFSIENVTQIIYSYNSFDTILSCVNYWSTKCLSQIHMNFPPL